MLHYIRSSANKGADERTSEILTSQIHNVFSHILGIGYFEGKFTLQVKNSSQTHQTPPEM